MQGAEMHSEAGRVGGGRFPASAPMEELYLRWRIQEEGRVRGMMQSLAGHRVWRL